MKCQIHRRRKLKLLSVADIMSMTFIRPTKVSLEFDQDLNHLVLIVVSVWEGGSDRDYLKSYVNKWSNTDNVF